jgi:hypothetical protein
MTSSHCRNWSCTPHPCLPSIILLASSIQYCCLFNKQNAYQNTPVL